MTLVRTPFTLAAALAFHVSMSPPSTCDSTNSPCDRRAVCTTSRFITALLTKGLFWASALTDTLVVLAPYVPASYPRLPPIHIPPAGTLLSWIQHPTRWGPGLVLALNHLTSMSPSLPFLPPLPLVTVAGTALALAGGYLRYAAYRALGRFYACTNRGTGPCVLHNKHGNGHAHALITTGPYAAVRHPGYAGLALCTTGLVMLHLDALQASRAGVGLWNAAGGAGVSTGMRAVTLVCAMLVTVGALRRIQDEERSLRARFKGEWEAWARNVPYKLIPGVY